MAQGCGRRLCLRVVLQSSTALWPSRTPASNDAALAGDAARSPAIIAHFHRPNRINALSETRWPEFYIVGAPRCGTSFMWHHLRQHPDVFMPADKDHPFFCHDLNTGTPVDRKMFIDEATYVARFEGRTGRLGDACAFDLFSAVAADEIRARRPDARILICLRDSEDQVRAWHHMRRGLGAEDLDLQAALEAEPARARGEHLPRNAQLVPMYQYTAVAQFEPQIERYVKAFGPERVAIFRLEDIKVDPASEFRRAVAFLGLRDWAPASFEVINATRRTRHATLLRLLTDERLIESTKRVIPRPLHRAAGRLAFALRDRTADRS